MQANAKNWVSEANDQSFQELVLKKSLELPVLVDFWADWCGPCKQLTPIVEELVQEYQGRFELVKIDIEASPNVAAAMRIQSIPFLVLFMGGRPVNYKMGVQTKAVLKAFLDEYIPEAEKDVLVLAKELFQAGELSHTLAVLDDALAQEPLRADLLLLQAKSYLLLGQVEQAAQSIQGISEKDPLFAEAKKLKQIFVFAQDAGNLQELKDQLSQKPENQAELLYQMAATYALKGDFEQACQAFLQSVAHDRGFREDAARKALLSLFDVLGADHELSGKYRRALAKYLF